MRTRLSVTYIACLVLLCHELRVRVIGTDGALMLFGVIRGVGTL